MGSLREFEPAESDVLDTAEAGGLIARGGALRIIGFVATVVLSLAGVVVLTRYLEPDRFGQYQTVASLMVVVAAVTDVGMATLGVREYAQRRDSDRYEFMRMLLGLRLALSVIGVAGGLLFTAAAGYPTPLVIGTCLAGLGLILTVVQTTLAIPLGVELRYGVLATMDVTRQALTTALIVALVLAGAGVGPLLGVTVPVQLFLIAWTFLLVRGKISARATFRPSVWKSLLGTTVAFALATAVGAVYTYLAQILTSLVATEFQTGVFSAAFRVYTVAAGATSILVATAFPLLSRAARDDHERLGYALGRLTQTTLIAGGAISIGTFLAAAPIIDIVGGPQYAASVPVLKILSFGMLAGFAIASWGYGLLALHEHRAMIYANLAALGVTGVLVLVLAQSPLGARGTAIGALCGEIVLGIGYAVGLSRAPADVTLLSREGLRAMGAIALSLVVGLLCPVPAIAQAVIGLGVYLALLAVLRVVPGEAVDLLPEKIGRRIPRAILS